MTMGYSSTWYTCINNTNFLFEVYYYWVKFIDNPMVTNINQLVESRVFREHWVSKGVFVTVMSLRFERQPSRESPQKKKCLANLLCGGRKLYTKVFLQFPSTKPQIGPIIKTCV